MRSEIGSMTLEQTFEERDTLNQAVVRIANETARAWIIECLQCGIRDIIPLASIKQAMEMQAEAEHSKRAEGLQSEEDQQSKINRHEESNEIATVLNNSYQFKIPEHMLNRNRSSQDYDVTGKESFNKDRENQRSERLQQIRT